MRSSTLLKAIALLTCIREVRGANLGGDTEVFCGIPQFVKVYAGTMTAPLEFVVHYRPIARLHVV
jgi:hypothetical protein